MTVKKTLQQFKNEVELISNGDYLIIDKEYVNNSTPIKFIHNSKDCGYNEFIMSPKNFLKGQRCGVCSGKQYNDYKFKEKVKELTQGEYEVLGKYINGSTKIHLKHCLCDYEYSVQPRKFIEGQRCPKCNRPNYATTEKDRKERFDDDNKDKSFRFIKSIDSRNLNIEHMCNDGKLFNFITNTKNCKNLKCPRCGDVKLKYRNNELFIEELDKLFDGKIVSLQKFTGVETKIKVKHLSGECNNYEWMAKPCNLLRGKGCPCCNISKGEDAIMKFLIKNKIDYIKEYSFEDLKSKKGNFLRFDFAIIENNDIKTLIEYDGIFHFEKTSLNNDVLYQIENDKRKNDYCENKNIKLIRIPYWEFENIDNILNNEICFSK